MSEACVAVLDVGKTNKKVLILGPDLAVRDSAYQQFPIEQERSDNGAEIHYERSDEAAEWFIDQLAVFARNYDIAAIGVTTHGATCACVAEDGSLAMPVLSYTTELPSGFDQRFYERFGGQRSMHQRYRTPYVAPLTNTGRMLAFIQEQFPQAWQRTRWVLHLPQFFVYRLTGVPSAEPTMLGCHSYMWDFDRAGYSDFVDAAGLRDRVPPEVAESGEVAGTLSAAIAQRTGLPASTPVILGVHDSNASLLPYLIHNRDRFVLNSTGTWCVAMCPAEDSRLSGEDLDSGAFFNASVFKQPVKTSLLAGGMEHDRYLEWFKSLHASDDYPEYDRAILQQVLSEGSAFVLPNVLPGTGPFPDSRLSVADADRRWNLADASLSDGPGFLADRKICITALGCSLALQSARQLRMVGAVDGTTIYVEGGFRRNQVYCQVLAHCFPHSKIAITNMPEATSVGAGLLALAAADQTDVQQLADRFAIDERVIDRQPLQDLDHYRQAFEAWVADASAER